MRISGVRVPPGDLPRWAALGVGLFLLAALAAFLANTLGLIGFTTSTEDTGTRVTATVSVGAPCTAAGANERVTFTHGGRESEARFDGCGHTEGEQVDITVPADTSAGDLVVQSARAAVGDGVPGEGVGTLLMVVASGAGAGYAYLLRRGRRGRSGTPRYR